jgi:preprotein translocase subunit SecF
MPAVGVHNIVGTRLGKQRRTEVILALFLELIWIGVYVVGAIVAVQAAMLALWGLLFVLMGALGALDEPGENHTLIDKWGM